jgi:hypothetical protein
MKNRPWIWIIVAHIAVIAALTHVVIVAQRNKQPEVPLTHVAARSSSTHGNGR